jgi:hypothetical protein
LKKDPNSNSVSDLSQTPTRIKNALALNKENVISKIVEVDKNSAVNGPSGKDVL